MKKRLLLPTITLTALAGWVISAPIASAQCGSTETVLLSCDPSQNGFLGILFLMINILSIGVGVVAIGAIAYASFLWTSAGDNEQQVAKSKEMLRNTVIGIIAYIAFFAFIEYIIPGGVFNRTFNIPVTSTNPSNPPTNPGGGSPGPTNPTGTVQVSDIRLRNFRDASTETNGNVLKPGLLYRSAALDNLNASNQRKLGELLGNSAIIIDLRPPGTDEPDKSVPGVRNINVPVEGFLDTAPAVTDPVRRRALGRALQLIADANGPVLVHCVAGKDRTGWTVAMVMYIAGANDRQVMKEYLKSLDANYVVKREWLNSGLQAARSNYGSITGYLKRGLGLSTADINKIKQKYGA